MIRQLGFSVFIAVAASATADAKLSQSISASTQHFPDVNRGAKADRLIAKRAATGHEKPDQKAAARPF